MDKFEIVKKCTDRSMMEIKKALYVANGDVEEAINYLLSRPIDTTRLVTIRREDFPPAPKLVNLCRICDGSGLVESWDSTPGVVQFEDCECKYK